MIKVISFDIGGTLIFKNNVNGYSIKDIADLVNKPYDDVKDAYKNIFQCTKGDFLVLINKFCNELNISINDEIINFFKNKFSNKDCYINNEVYGVLKELKNRNYKIILFSNNCCLMDNSLNDDILKYVDDIFYSYDLGFTKSEEQSYRIIENKMNCNSNEILHIGDTLQSDYLEPIKYGWNAIYYGNSEYDNITKINTLNEILNII